MYSADYSDTDKYILRKVNILYVGFVITYVGLNTMWG